MLWAAFLEGITLFIKRELSGAARSLHESNGKRCKHSQSTGERAVKVIVFERERVVEPPGSDIDVDIDGAVVTVIPCREQWWRSPPVGGSVVDEVRAGRSGGAW